MNRVQYLVRFVLILALLFTTAVIAVSPTAAQGTQPQQYDPAVVKKAVDLLQKYNIPPTALDNLVGMLNNPEKLTETLKGFGLAEDAINGLYQEALPLIQEAGLDPSDIQRYTVDKAREFLAENGISEDRLDDFLQVQGDKAAVETFLKEEGLAEDKLEEVQQGLSYYEAMGLDKQSHAYILAQQALEITGKYGLKPTDLGDILPHVNDPQKMMEVLGQKGLTPDQIQQALQEASPLIQEGLQAGVMLDYVQQHAINILSGQGLSPEEYQELLSKREDAQAFAEELKAAGFSDEEITQIANEFATLGELGFDDEAVAGLVEDLQEHDDSLASEFDPENALQDPESDEEDSEGDTDDTDETGTGEGDGEDNSEGTSDEGEGEGGENSSGS